MEKIIILSIICVLVLIIIPCIQSLSSNFHNPYNKYKIYKNYNNKYIVKYVDYYAYGIIPIWIIFKLRDSNYTNVFKVCEFNTKEQADIIMAEAYRDYIEHRNKTRIKK